MPKNLVFRKKIYIFAKFYISNNLNKLKKKVKNEENSFNVGTV